MLLAPPSQAVPAAMSQVHQRAYENQAWVSLKALSILILRPGVAGGEGYSGSQVTGVIERGKTTKKVQKTLMRILNRHYKDLWSMMQLWCINVSKVCHLATYQINFQVELLSMIDIQDIEIASIFHPVESMLANVLFITLVWKLGIF